MSRNARKWWHGLGAAAVMGFVVGLSAIVQDPLYFNLQNWADAKRTLTHCIAPMILMVVAYLKQSPLPPLEETTIVTRTVEVKNVTPDA